MTLDSRADLPTLILSWEELFAVTGYKRATDQASAIRDHYGIRAYVNPLGRAIVVRAHLEAANKPEEKPKKQVRKVA